MQSVLFNILQNLRYILWTNNEGIREKKHNTTKFYKTYLQDTYSYQLLAMSLWIMTEEISTCTIIFSHQNTYLKQVASGSDLVSDAGG